MDTLREDEKGNEMDYVFLFGLITLGGLLYYVVTCDGPKEEDK